MHSERESPSQFYPSSGQKGRPRKRKIAQGSPEDMQVQTMRMASTALGELNTHFWGLLSSINIIRYEAFLEIV